MSGFPFDYAVATQPLFRHRRALVLFAADCAALLGTMLCAALIREWMGGDIDGSRYAPLLFFLFLAPLINYYEGLYSATPPALPEELRILGISTSFSYLCIAIFFFLSRGETPSRFVYLGAWLMSLGIVPLVRCQVRHICSRRIWWRVPAVLFGQSELSTRLEGYLEEHPTAGIRPVALYINDATCTKQLPNDTTCTKQLPSDGAPPDILSLLLLKNESDLADFVKTNPGACAIIVATKDASLHCRRDMIDLASRQFSSVILVPEDFADGEIPFWVRPLEIGDMLCLKVRQNLLDPRRLALKRAMDLVLSLIGGLILVPFLIFIALCIRLESRGPALFHQKRIGRDGKTIEILKFRTMVHNAEEVLQNYLARNPELRQEWEADQKLRNDPRITRMGTFLRRTSLDELPQLWNVACGDMSLVGPRPIVEEEIPKYGRSFSAYTRVRPGMTGLWQVSGRNDLSYQQRVHIDRYYICNWSTWLDLLILARTFPVVFGRRGAY